MSPSQTIFLFPYFHSAFSNIFQHCLDIYQTRRIILSVPHCKPPLKSPCDPGANSLGVVWEERSESSSESDGAEAPSEPGFWTCWPVPFPVLLCLLFLSIRLCIPGVGVPPGSRPLGPGVVWDQLEEGCRLRLVSMFPVFPWPHWNLFLSFWWSGGDLYLPLWELVQGSIISCL